MKKKIRIILVITGLAYLVYFFGSIMYSSIKYLNKKNTNDFSYVKKSFKVPVKDSMYFSNKLMQNLQVIYSSQFNDTRYLAFYTYLNKFNLVVRQLSVEKGNLFHLYKPILKKSSTDVLVRYDIEEMLPFLYKIDIERRNGANRQLMIDGESIEILKHTEDSLLIHGKFYSFSIGYSQHFVSEGLYLQDETFFRKPIDVELLIFNREDQLFEYVLFPIGNQSLPKKLIKEIR